MLVKRIERSNGGCYFIAAKFADRACPGTPQLSWCCRYLDWKGLESFCFKQSEGMVCSSSAFGPPAKRTEIITFNLGEV